MSSSSSTTPEPLDARFQLKLPSFEGPLDLLLHLCQKHELDIVNLPVAFVTERYLDYIRLMERLDLDIASEYLVMAATLAHIKSKSLLPPDPTQDAEEGAEEEEIDPRQELIRRLLEYQKYKAAAEDLGARGVQGRDVFLRGMEAPEATGPAPLAGVGLFKLLDAFQVVLKRAKQDLAFQITAEGVSIQDRMTQLADRLRTKRRCTFDELFDDVKTMYDVVVTFLALLEMAKRRLARVYQSEPTAPIHLEYRVLDADGDETASEEAREGAPAAPDGPEDARSGAPADERDAARIGGADPAHSSAAAQTGGTDPAHSSAAAEIGETVPADEDAPAETGRTEPADERASAETGSTEPAHPSASAQSGALDSTHEDASAESDPGKLAHEDASAESDAGDRAHEDVAGQSGEATNVDVAPVADPAGEPAEDPAVVAAREAEEAEWAALLAEEAALEAARAAEEAELAALIAAEEAAAREADGAALDLEPEVAQDPRPAEPEKPES